MEEWKDIEGYEGLYQVSNEGRVKSLGNNKYKKDKILKPNTVRKGYLRVVLSKNNIASSFNIHRLVAKAFIPNSEGKPCVGHKDCNSKNNIVENLYWCTYLENNNHPTTKERQSNAKQGGRSYFANRVISDEERKIISNRFSKKVYQYSLDGEFIKEWKSASECGKNGYSTSAIRSCCSGKRKTSNGYKWSFKPL